MSTDNESRGVAIYGHRHLGVFFKPLVSTDAAGFEYRRTRYRWNDVASVELHELINIGAARFRATVKLTNGVKIHLNGRALEKQGKRPVIGFLSTRTDAFDELIARFRQHAA
jgi:hypothetical protein